MVGARRLLLNHISARFLIKTSADCARMRPAFLKMSMSSKIWKISGDLSSEPFS